MRIKELRQAAGVTQQALAEQLHVDRSAVAYWENGTAMPKAALLPALADALGCTIDALFGRGEETEVS